MGFSEIQTAFVNPDGSNYQGDCLVRVPEALLLPDGSSVPKGEMVFPVVNGVAYRDVTNHLLMKVPATTTSLPATALDFLLRAYPQAMPRAITTLSIPESTVPLNFGALVSSGQSGGTPATSQVNAAHVVNGGAYQLAVFDYFVVAQPTPVGTAITLTLPTAPDTTRPYTLKDGGGNAATSPIRVYAPAGYTFEAPYGTDVNGLQYLDIDADFMARTLRVVGTIWGNVA